MNPNKPFYTKLFVLLLAALFLGSSFAVLATGKEGEEDYAVTLDFGKTEETIARGDTASYHGTIMNSGELDDNYKVSFGGRDHGKEGIDVELANRDTDDVIDLENLSLGAGEKLQVVLYITIDRNNEADYEISMLLRSHNDEDAWDVVKTVTTLIQENEKDYAFELEAWETDQVTHYNVPVSYFMTLVNTGNVEDSYLVKLDYAEEYLNVEAFLMVLGEDGDPGSFEETEPGEEMEVSLEAGEKLLLALEVEIFDELDEDDDDEKEGESGDERREPASQSGSWKERYIVRVSAQSQGGPEILKSVKTVTHIKEEEPARLVFESYESEKQIVKGGEAEYLLYLTNQGWSPVEVTLGIDPYPYSDIETELYLIAPYWLLATPGTEGLGGQTGGGLVYDADGNIVRFAESDIVWGDYGGLIPVDEDFSYDIYPYDWVQFLLTVDHLDDSTGGGDVNITLHSQDYEVSVTVKGEGDIEETVTTTTEVVYNPVYGIDMQLRDKRQLTYPNNPAEFIIDLKNTGNVDEMVELEIGGEAYGLEGVSAYLYARDGWDWCGTDDPWFHGIPEPEPVFWLEEGEEFEWEYEDDCYWDYVEPITIYQNGQKQFHNTDPAIGMMPYWEQGELQLFLEAGREIKLVLQVYVSYEEGSYNVTVTGQVPEQDNTARTVSTETVIKEVEYLGFEMKAPTTKQTMVAGEYVDYQISLYNPGYYTDDILLELGGEDINDPAVDTQLFLKHNVYYYEADYGEYIRKDNPDVYFEYAGGIYDPADMSKEAFDEKTGSGDPGTRGGSGENGNDDDPEEYYLDSSGAIFKNYEYEYEIWEDPTIGFDEDQWLTPLPRGEKSISLGPFEEVWLVLRVTIEEEGDYAIDLTATSQDHPEYKKVVSTETTVKEGGEAALELFIGDPNHYTAFGVTTVYVFQLSNTGELRDTVKLDVAGKDAFEPNVYVELGVKGAQPTEPVFLEDRYGATILPYDGNMDDVDDDYYFEQWTSDPDVMEFIVPEDGPNTYNSRNLKDHSGMEIDAIDFGDPVNDPGMNAPVQYSFKNWDLAEGDVTYGAEGLDELNFLEMPGEGESDYFHLDQGFIPYHEFGEKYVELEPGQTVIVTMKVAVYDYWDVDYPQWLDDLAWDWDDEKNPEGESHGGEGAKEKEEGDEKENGLPEKTKEAYEIVLKATSRRNPQVQAKAKTLTHIYDEDVRKGIETGKLSGVVNVFSRNMSQEILEQGFEILPQALESGRIEFKVRGEFDEGRLMVININASNLQQLGDFDVLFDQIKMKRMSAEKIVDYDGTEARYVYTETENGAQIMVYIPHFSEHDITIQSSTAQQDSGSSNGAVLVAGMLMAVVVGIIGFGYIQRREEARKKEFRLKLHENEGFQGIKETNAPVDDKELESLLDESLIFGKKE